MKIEHIAIWTKDLERVKNFYEKYFHVTPSEKYFNPNKNFESYFLRFEDGARLEIMRKPEIATRETNALNESIGLAHFAISVGSKEKVNTLSEQLRQDGFQIVGEPRTTGDGYYESVILDPEGNRIEITI
jgi:lactoylglutathione lyase